MMGPLTVPLSHGKTFRPVPGLATILLRNDDDSMSRIQRAAWLSLGSLGGRVPCMTFILLLALLGVSCCGAAETRENVLGVLTTQIAKTEPFSAPVFTRKPITGFRRSIVTLVPVTYIVSSKEIQTPDALRKAVGNVFEQNGWVEAIPPGAGAGPGDIAYRAPRHLAGELLTDYVVIEVRDTVKSVQCTYVLRPRK
jgi:hypothetical protein